MTANNPDPGELIAEAKRLDAEATPGPWLAHKWQAYVYRELEGGREGAIAGLHCTVGKLERERDNAVFIARARTLVPELASALERQVATLAAVRALITKWETEPANYYPALTCLKRNAEELRAALEKP